MTDAPWSIGQGTALPLCSDKTTGTYRKVYLFVAPLPFSMCCYRTVPDMKKEEPGLNQRPYLHYCGYFGGVARSLTPDSLKEVGILSSKKYRPLSPSIIYQELADY